MCQLIRKELKQTHSLGGTYLRPARPDGLQMAEVQEFQRRPSIRVVSPFYTTSRSKLAICALLLCAVVFFVDLLCVATVFGFGPWGRNLVGAAMLTSSYWAAWYGSTSFAFSEDLPFQPFSTKCNLFWFVWFIAYWIASSVSAISHKPGEVVPFRILGMSLF